MYQMQPTDLENSEELLQNFNQPTELSELSQREPKDQRPNTRKNSRTPSGSILQNKVESAKKFFSPNHLQNTLDSSFSLSEHEDQTDFNHGTNSQLTGALKAQLQKAQRVKRKPAKQKVQEKEVGTTTQTKLCFEHDQLKVTSDKKRKNADNDADVSTEETSVNSNSEKLTVNINCNSNVNEVTSKRTRMEDKNSDEKCEEFIQSVMTEDLQVMDVRTVAAMFEEIKISVKKEKEEWSADLERIQNATKKKVDDDLQQTFSHYDEEIKRLKGEITDLKMKAKLSTDVLHYNEALMIDMSKRLEDLETSSAKRSAILSGLKLDGDKKTRLQQLMDFFQDTMSIAAKIDDSYLLGKREPQPTVIIFASVADKNTVFEKKSLLRFSKNEEGKGIYLNHYLSAGENERRKRERDIKRLNSELPKEQQINIEYEKGNLLLNKTAYRKLVQPPSPTTFLDYTSQDLDRILKIPTSKGKQIDILDSHFLAYSVDADKPQRVKDTYLKIRLMHARARHIVCVYNLPGAEKERILCQDYCEDGEIGVGQILLHMMQDNNVSHRAFFIVRVCGQMKLREDRVTGYKKAMESCLSLHPHNSITKADQKIDPHLASKKKNAPTSSSPTKVNQDQRSPTAYADAVRNGNTNANLQERMEIEDTERKTYVPRDASYYKPKTTRGYTGNIRGRGRGRKS